MRGRDGCRVPVPWTADGPSLGFGPGEPWLPQPADWSASCRCRRRPGVAGLDPRALPERPLGCANLLGLDLEWLDAAPGSLAFRRQATAGGAVVCAVNTGAAPVPVPAHDAVVLASEPLDGGLLPGRRRRLAPRGSWRQRPAAPT